MTAPSPWNRCCNLSFTIQYVRISGLLLLARWRWLRRRSSHVAFAAILEADASVSGVSEEWLSNARAQRDDSL